MKIWEFVIRWTSGEASPVARDHRIMPAGRTQFTLGSVMFVLFAIAIGLAIVGDDFDLLLLIAFLLVFSLLTWGLLHLITATKRPLFRWLDNLRRDMEEERLRGLQEEADRKPLPLNPEWEQAAIANLRKDLARRGRHPSEGRLEDGGQPS